MLVLRSQPLNDYWCAFAFGLDHNQLAMRSSPGYGAIFRSIGTRKGSSMRESMMPLPLAEFISSAEEHSK
jgi:hypothetical protein